MKHITILYLLFLEYLEHKINQCIHCKDYQALKRTKEILKRDFEKQIEKG